MMSTLADAGVLDAPEAPADQSPDAGWMGRSRFLRRMSAAIVGIAVLDVLKAAPVGASHCGPVPTGCRGPGRCCSCNSPYFGVCPSGTNCWYYTDDSQCITYRCCDYWPAGLHNFCVCRSVVCRCC